VSHFSTRTREVLQNPKNCRGSLGHDPDWDPGSAVRPKASTTAADFFLKYLLAFCSFLARAPTLAWVLSVSTTKSPVVAATSTDPMQQLAPLASNLDVVRRSVEQLAAKQEQMAQNIAALQAVEEDIRQKMSITPPAPAQQAASIPQHKPQQPRAQSSAAQSTSVPRTPPTAGPDVLSR